MQLTRSLAEPLMKRGIRICALCPQASMQSRQPPLELCCRHHPPCRASALPVPYLLHTMLLHCLVMLRCAVQFTDTALVRGMQQANAEQAAEVMKDTQGRLLTVDKVGRR